MKKTEFIERYGAEAYEKRLAKTREYNKQYRQDNVDYFKQYKKLYYQQNVDAIKAKSKEYRQKNAEHYREYNKQYRQDNADNLKQYKKQYRQDNVDAIKDKVKQYYQTPVGRAGYLARGYKREDHKYNRQNNISADYIVNRIFNSKCLYCGETDWTKLGCDRIFNEYGHLEWNVVPCCADCNNKRQKMGHMDFYESTLPKRQEYKDYVNIMGGH